MFSSKFEGLAELEAIRAGLKPSYVRFIQRTVVTAPKAAAVDDRTDATPDARDEAGIREEMERRLSAYLADGKRLTGESTAARRPGSLRR